MIRCAGSLRQRRWRHTHTHTHGGCPSQRARSHCGVAVLAAARHAHGNTSATGTQTRVARVRAEYPNQLDYSGGGRRALATATRPRGSSATCSPAFCGALHLRQTDAPAPQRRRNETTTKPRTHPQVDTLGIEPKAFRMQPAVIAQHHVPSWSCRICGEASSDRSAEPPRPHATHVPKPRKPQTPRLAAQHAAH